jgi:hypothetical protein
VWDRSAEKGCRYKGIFLDKRTGRYRAAIQTHGKRRYLAYFATAEEAARAYDAACKEDLQEWATTNFTEMSRRKCVADVLYQPS